MKDSLAEGYLYSKKKKTEPQEAKKDKDLFFVVLKIFVTIVAII